MPHDVTGKEPERVPKKKAALVAAVPDALLRITKSLTVAHPTIHIRNGPPFDQGEQGCD